MENPAECKKGKTQDARIIWAGLQAAIVQKPAGQSTGTLSGRETDFRAAGAPERFRASEGPAGVRGISLRGKRSARKGGPGA